MSEKPSSPYRWYLLALLTATGTFVSAIPFSCLPVLFPEIAEDLGLSLVEVGTVWGISSLAGIFVSIVGGLLSDRFGVKAILSVFCILTGVTGALRGFSSSFLTLTLTVFLNGMVRMVIPVNITKTVGLWFKGPQLGMAMGVSAVGIGLGLMLGPLVSATIISPWLGGWRNVMYFYGGISCLVGVVWLIFGRDPSPDAEAGATAAKIFPGRIFIGFLRNRALWILGGTMLFRWGSIMGMTGYLPTYLQRQGWPGTSADGTLAAFYAVSTLGVIPLSILSDRLGSRKAILIPALVSSLVALGLLPMVDGGAVWILVLFAGFFFDGFMAIASAMALETEGVAPQYSGMALGIVYTIGQFGSLVSPALGNSFARIGPGWPFVFWAGLSLLALLVFAWSRDTTPKKPGA